MSWTTQQRIRFAFWILTFATIVLGVVAVRNAVELADAARDVAQTNELVKELEKLLSTLKDVEVAEREYVLTGDEQYVAQISQSRKAVDAGVRQLGTMRPDELWLELLNNAIPEKFSEIEKTVKLRRSAGVEAASRMVLPKRGDGATDDISNIVSGMIREENRLLAERTAAQRSRYVTTMILFGAVLVITVALIWSVFYLIRRESERVQQLTRDLERRVALRTEELQRSNEDLQQFAYVASHDIKEPMRMISSYATLLQRRYADRLDSTADTYIGFVIDGVKRMNDLVTDLLEYSRAGQSGDEQEVPVDPAQVLQSVLQNLKVMIAESNASVSSDELPTVLYDPVRLGQLLQNLIANAIKYRGNESPRIHISATRRYDQTVFSVRDNGMGIKLEHREQIFGPFKRLHGTEIEGTGIGLAMCKKTVERFGGRIWVESEPGQGSTFFFTVPDRKPATSQAAG